MLPLQEPHHGHPLWSGSSNRVPRGTDVRRLCRIARFLAGGSVRNSWADSDGTGDLHQLVDRPVKFGDAATSPGKPHGEQPTPHPLVDILLSLSWRRNPTHPLFLALGWSLLSPVCWSPRFNLDPLFGVSSAVAATSWERPRWCPGRDTSGGGPVDRLRSGRSIGCGRLDDPANSPQAKE